MAGPREQTAAVSDPHDLARAFRYLGRGPSYRQLDAVVKRLHAEGLEELPDGEELEEIAEQNGSMGVVALDLETAFYFGTESLYAGPRHSTEESEGS